MPSRYWFRRERGQMKQSECFSLSHYSRFQEWRQHDSGMGGCHERKLPCQDQHKSQRHIRGVCQSFIPALRASPCVQELAEHGQLIWANSVKRICSREGWHQKVMAQATEGDKRKRVCQPFRKGKTHPPAIWLSFWLKGRKRDLEPAGQGRGTRWQEPGSLCHCCRGGF